jgi:LuxR family maltose regulon positive regulatory protein
VAGRAIPGGTVCAEGGPVGTAAVSFGGDDRLVSEYLESEFLARISGRHRAFLTRSAVLMRMSGALCEAVLDLPGAAATLAGLARSNLLLVPLDRRGQWYRYHHLFQDMLLAELERTEPGLAPVLRRRAANWCLVNGLAEEALEYSLAAEDGEMAAGLMGKLWLPVCRQGRYATAQRRFYGLADRGGVDRYPMIAAQAAMVAANIGRPDEAERWADAVDRWQYAAGPRAEDLGAEAWAATLRAILCRRGITQMRADADEAAQKLTAVGIAPSSAALCQGIACVLSGDLDGGDRWLQETVRVAHENGGPQVEAEALSELALLAKARGDWSRAEALADRASIVLRQAGIGRLLPCAVQARVAMYRGDLAAVRQQLVTAQRLRPASTYGQPHVAVQARIELIRVHLALADITGARTLMQEIDEIFRHRPDLGTLVGQVKQLQARLGKEHGPNVPGASALTAAELHLLPLLSTHLKVPEIAADLFLSPNTIKSQIRSIYRKLDATSRHQAVTRARELELIDR